jgi:hypothetical protein
MAVNPIPDGAILERLINILSQSKIQSTNPALYQTIKGLITQVQQQINIVQGNASDIDILISSGGAGINELTGDVTAGPGTGSQVATIANNAVTNTKLRDSAALSVIGRSANSSGDPADISTSAASAAVLRESGSVLGFGTVATAGIANDAVTYAKIQNVSAASRVLGRGSAAGAGDTQELTVGSGLSISGTVLDAVSGGSGINQLTGDVTAGPGVGSQAATIPNNTVTYAKMQDISATQRLLGRNSAGSGDVEEVTISQALDWLT